MNYTENQKDILLDLLEEYQGDLAFLKAVNSLSFALIQMLRDNQNKNATRFPADTL
jgi:hypothetical protein